MMKTMSDWKFTAMNADEFDALLGGDNVEFLHHSDGAFTCWSEDDGSEDGSILYFDIAKGECYRVTVVR